MPKLHCKPCRGAAFFALAKYAMGTLAVMTLALMTALSNPAARAESADSTTSGAACRLFDRAYVPIPIPLPIPVPLRTTSRKTSRSRR